MSNWTSLRGISFFPPPFNERIIVLFIESWWQRAWMKRCVHICRYSTDLIRMSALHQAVDKTLRAVVNFKANFFMNGPHCLAGNEAMWPVTSPQINTVSSWLPGICLLQMEAVDTLRLGITLSKHGKQWEERWQQHEFSICYANKLGALC